jgi:hypothetical protein
MLHSDTWGPSLRHKGDAQAEYYVLDATARMKVYTYPTNDNYLL